MQGPARGSCADYQMSVCMCVRARVHACVRVHLHVSRAGSRAHTLLLFLSLSLALSLSSSLSFSLDCILFPVSPSLVLSLSLSVSLSPPPLLSSPAFSHWHGHRWHRNGHEVCNTAARGLARSAQATHDKYECTRPSADTQNILLLEAGPCDVNILTVE